MSDDNKCICRLNGMMEAFIHKVGCKDVKNEVNLLFLQVFCYFILILMTRVVVKC